MEQVGWVIGAALILAIAGMIWRSAPKKAATSNALLAEHLLAHVELVPENPFAKALADNIVQLWRSPDFPKADNSDPTEAFNSATRFVQLNLVAMALLRMPRDPLLPNEHWHDVKNPFATGLENSKLIRARADQLKWAHRADVRIPDKGRFRITPWGLSDNDAAANDQPTRAESFQPHPPVPFSASLPDLTKCDALRIYEIGNYLALIVANPKPYAAAAGFDMHVVDYIYAMAISSANPPGPPLLFVTAERTGSDLTAMLQKATGHQQTSDPFLCVFDSSGAHHNLGCSSDFTDLEIFSTYALNVARERLHIQGDVVIVDRTISTDSVESEVIVCPRCHGAATITHDEHIRRARSEEYILGLSNMVVETTDAYVCAKCGWRKLLSQDLSPL